MPTHTKDKYIIVVPAILLLAFTSFKSFSSSITVDEATSFLNFAQDSIYNIFTFKDLDPNNHVLNTLLMKMFTTFLPLSELTVRIQSLLAHAIYLAVTWLLIKDFKNTWFRLSVYLFLNLNPFVLDFFSLARGYALSWAFLVLSLYFLKLFVENTGRKFIVIILCFVCAALSGMASFPTLHYYLALLAVYTAYNTWQIVFNWNGIKNKAWFWGGMLFVLLLSACFLTYIASINYRLLHAGQLYFGSRLGFWQDTVNSLIDSSLYGAPYSAVGAVALQVFGIITIMAVVAFFALSVLVKKARLYDNAFFFAITTILLLIVLSIMMMHYAIGIKFLVERTAVYILIIFLLVAAYLFNLIIPDRYKLASAFLIGGIPLAHFAFTCNTSSFYEWKFDACTRKVMQDLGEIHKNKNNTQDSLTFFLPAGFNACSCAFYQQLYKYNWMLPVVCTYDITHFEDYYYFASDELNLLDLHSYRVIKKYPAVNEELVENIRKVKGTNYGNKDLNLYDTVHNNAVLKGSISTGEIAGKKYIFLNKGTLSPPVKFNAGFLKSKQAIYVQVSATVYFPGVKNGEIVISINNKANKTLKEYSYDLNHYRLQDSGWMIIPFMVKIDDSIPDTESIQAFIRNNGDKPIYASEIKGTVTGF